MFLKQLKFTDADVYQKVSLGSQQACAIYVLHMPVG